MMKREWKRRSKLLVMMAMMFCAGFIATNAKGKDAVIEDGKKVKFDYVLKVDGKVVESSEGKAPLEYTQGEGQIIKGLSKQMEGLKAGDKKEITVKPEDGYGEVVQAAFKEFPKSSFPAEPELAKGMVVEMKTPEGVSVPGIIWEIKDDSVVINFNHPLAGKTLTFDVTVDSVE